MPKKTGNIYLQMTKWDNIVHAEKTSTKRKPNNYGVRMHVKNRIGNLVEIQQMLLRGEGRTDEYVHAQIVSGQDKLRHIAKLPFHPNSIRLQLLTETSYDRIDKSLISHTYASRIGYGQVRGALQVQKWIREHPELKWYAQGDICQYYNSIPHELIRQGLEKRFKDQLFIREFMEPFQRFTQDGTAIPLGIRPSQSTGNFVLDPLDRTVKEEAHAEFYIRYLDDFLILGKTKGEVKRIMKRAQAKVTSMGFRLHEPKVRRISEGIDFLGFVTYEKGDAFWRKSNKVRYLKHRARVSNPKRQAELDNSAKGMLMWGNKHCQRLYKKKTGMSILQSGYKRREKTDRNGKGYIEAPELGMPAALNRLISVDKWIDGFTTSYGPGRMALQVEFAQAKYKVIVNAEPVKNFFRDMDVIGVTKVQTVFIDTGGRHYDVDLARTEVLEIDNRHVTFDQRTELYVFDGTSDTFDLGKAMADIQRSKGEAGMAADAK